MNDWQRVRLDQCCDIVGGSTPSTSVAAYWDGDICWATPKDLSQLEGAYIADTPRKITQSGLSSCAATVLPINSVLFSSRAPIGHVAVNTVPMATNQGFKSFVPKSDRIHAKFLYHWLRMNRAYLESLGNGATFKEVSKTIVSRIEIPLPSLPEQRRIAAILDHADDLRTKRRAALAHLDMLTQSIFLDLFQQVSLPIPTFAIGDSMEAIIDYRGKTPKKAEFGVPLITARVVKGGALLEPTEFIAEEDYDAWMRRGLPKPGDVIFTTEAPLGEVAQLDGRKVALAQRLLVLRGKPSLLNNTFLKHVLTWQEVREQIVARSTGSTVRGIRQKELRKVMIPVPPLSIQQEFERRISLVTKLKAINYTSLTELDALFASLQHRAFSGEL